MSGFRASGRRLDVLVCNAAIYQPTAKEPSFTADGAPASTAPRGDATACRRMCSCLPFVPSCAACRAAHLCAATQGKEQAKTSCGCDRAGFEISTGTNHLGHFLLANSLLEDIQVCSPSFLAVAAEAAAAEAVAAKADPSTHLLSASGVGHRASKLSTTATRLQHAAWRLST